MLKMDEKSWRYAAWAVFGLIAVLILLTFRHYGVTWDEELQSQYGQAIVDYYLSGFHDDHYAEIFNLYLYGGMFDGLASLVDRYTPFVVYDTRHLINALFGLLGLWGTWRLGKFIGGGAVGFVALLLLILTPMYYGHMFNNPKDIPFTTGIVWTLYFMSRCMGDKPRPKISLIIKLGIVFGLTLGVRVGGVMVLAFWAVPVGWVSLRQLWVGRGKKKKFRAALAELIRDEVRIILPAAIAAYSVLLLCWPWAQQGPVANPIKALSEFSNFPQDVEVLLNGTIYRSTQLPWSYVPLYFGVQLPELLLLLLLASAPLMPWIVRKLKLPQKQALTLLVLTAFVPILYAIIHRPALYDAVRHFLFAVPLMCILAALAGRHIYVWAVGEFRQKWAKRWVAWGMLAAFALAAGSQIALMAQLHPYEYVYINRFAGGVQNAFGRYEMDYWGTSFREAVERLHARVTQEGGIPSGKIYRIAICGPWDSAMIFLPPNYKPVTANLPAEFFLSTTRWMCQNMRSGPEIIRVERMGVPLSVIKDLQEK
ncbi:MAG: glycosyltransferase family 39 protein [Alphaproteobacteria bacterium]|nr:glycosyltransferase family 39 protein [Alphaproteobacteria bacterium]